MKMETDWNMDLKVKVTSRETKEKIVNLLTNSHDEQKSISSQYGPSSFVFIRMTLIRRVRGMVASEPG